MAFDGSPPVIRRPKALRALSQAFPGRPRMLTLDQYLQQFFGGRHADGQRLVAINDAHAVHEAGYEVKYSRYSVTYCGTEGNLSLGAEFDEDGVLVVHSLTCRDRATIERINTALAFLKVKYVHA
jgi:hypothetical protein